MGVVGQEGAIMDRFDSEQIRNVALIGHTGVGKTTLVEAILTHTGAIRRAGRVEDGTTVCDHEPEEIAHHMTMGLSLAPCVVEGSVVGTVKLNLVDTPGYADYTADVAAALAVVDLAVVVVSAVEGVQVQTEVAWDMAAQARLPRVILVTQLDRERADFDAVLGRAPLELRRRGGTAGAAHRQPVRVPRRGRPVERYGGHL